MAALLEKWKNREEKYPWILTFISLMLFFSFNFISYFTISNEETIQKAYTFCFNDLLSLFLWIPAAFLCGFLKNQNISWDKEFKGGTISRSIIYGSVLYFGVAIYFVVISIINDTFFPSELIYAASETKIELLIFVMLSSVLGCLISIVSRGSLYPEFIKLDE